MQRVGVYKCGSILGLLLELKMFVPWFCDSWVWFSWKNSLRVKPNHCWDLRVCCLKKRKRKKKKPLRKRPLFMSQVALPLLFSLFVEIGSTYSTRQWYWKNEGGEHSPHYYDLCACGCFVHSRLIITSEVAIGAKEEVHQEEALVERVEFHCHHVLKIFTPFQDLKRFDSFLQVWVFQLGLK